MARHPRLIRKEIVRQAPSLLPHSVTFPKVCHGPDPTLYLSHQQRPRHFWLYWPMTFLASYSLSPSCSCHLPPYYPQSKQRAILHPSETFNGVLATLAVFAASTSAGQAVSWSLSIFSPSLQVKLSSQDHCCSFFFHFTHSTVRYLHLHLGGATAVRKFLYFIEFHALFSSWHPFSMVWPVFQAPQALSQQLSGLL